jgi:arylsulfatase A-like enzyme
MIRFLLALLAAAPSVLAGGQPNIVLIITDDAGYADFGFTGCADWETPAIDRLAREGVTFSQGYVTAAVCSPSRAGLLTGRYQQRFGHEFNLVAYTATGANGLSLDERTIADYLKHAGYETGAIGKWHLGEADEYHPTRRGFDEFHGLLKGSRSYWALDEDAPRARRLLDGDKTIAEPDDLYVTDWITAKTVAAIRRDRSAPFFLFVSYTAVHTPMHAKEEDLAGVAGVEPQRRRKLAAMTEALDRGISEILHAIDDAGIDDQTLVIFLNDNGGATNNGSSNGPYRGMKGSKWEGGIRVPMVIRYPGVLPAGAVYDEPVMSFDLTATALAIADALPGDRRLDGVDLRPFVRGQTNKPPHEALFWRRGVAAAVRAGDMKLIRVETNPVMLFDLASDPGETTNLAPERPEIVAELTRRLEQWEEGLAEPTWVTADPWRRNQILKHRMEVVGREAERELP